MGATRPYTRHYQVTAASGQHNCFALAVPRRGFIERLVVHEASGGAHGYSFDLYDSLLACEFAAGESVSESPDYDPALNKLQATQTVSATNRNSAQYGIALPYENQDPQDDRKLPTCAIYIDLQPAGSGDKEYEIAITITHEIE